MDVVFDFRGSAYCIDTAIVTPFSSNARSTAASPNNNSEPSPRDPRCLLLTTPARVPPWPPLPTAVHFTLCCPTPVPYRSMRLRCRVTPYVWPRVEQILEALTFYLPLFLTGGDVAK